MKHPINGKVKVNIKLFDDTALDKYIGKEGIIVEHNSNMSTGNTEADPLHRVRFEDGVIEDFWYEELTIIT